MEQPSEVTKPLRSSREIAMGKADKIWQEQEQEKEIKTGKIENKANEQTSEEALEQAEINIAERDAEKIAKLRESIDKINSNKVVPENIQTKSDHKVALAPEYFSNAFVNDKLELRNNGGLYMGDQGLFADIPMDNKKKFSGIVDKIKSISADAAKALELMWENGDNRSPLSEYYKPENIQGRDFGRNRDVFVNHVPMNFLRGGEYKTRMKKTINSSYESKEDREAENFLSRIKGSLAAGATVGVMSGLAGFANGGLALQLAGAGFAGAGFVPMLGFGAWRLYKYFRNKKIHKNQMNAIEKL